jgi:hypothetical protein
LIWRFGELYISDDYSGAVYRLQYTGKQASESNKIEAFPVAERKVKSITKPISVDVEKAGYKLLDQNGCFNCHSLVDSDSGVPLSRAAAKFDDNSLSEFFESPTPPMPSYTFSPAEVSEIRSFLNDLVAEVVE